MPGRELCSQLEKFIQEELPRRTVNYEGSLDQFTLMPAAETRVRNLVERPVESETSVLAQLGYTSFTVEDVRRLVRLENWSGVESQFWISDNAINLMTNLFSAFLFPMDTRQVYYFSFLFAKTVRDLHFGVGTPQKQFREREGKGIGWTTFQNASSEKRASISVLRLTDRLCSLPCKRESLGRDSDVPGKSKNYLH